MLSRVVDQRVASFETLENRRLFAIPTDLDLSFSGDGKVVTDFGGANDIAHAVAVQGDGKIVVAGETQVSVNGVKTTAFAAVRFNSDGSLDDGGPKDITKGDKFGTAGKFFRVLDQGGGTGALAVALQKDGKIILGGNAIKSAASGQQWYFLRLNKDGTLDSGFGKLGVQSTSFIPVIEPKFKAMALQPDGKLIVAGGTEGDWHLERLTTGGQFDKTFNGSGAASADFGGNAVASAINFDNLGNIVVAGTAAGTDVGLARFDSNGGRDFTFGMMGRTIYKRGALSTEVSAITVLPAGDIQVAVGGTFAASGGGVISAGTAYRFSANGTSFGNIENFGLSAFTGVGNLPSDIFVAGGTSIRNGPGRFYLYAAGLGTQREVNFGANADLNVATAMAITPDGKIVQVGYTTAGGGGRNFAIARYVGKPTKEVGLITGRVFNDTDQDGFNDPNEPGQSNIRVFVDSNNNGLWDGTNEQSVLTDNNGNYKLFVKPGNYRICEINQTPLTQTLPGNPSGSYFVNISAGKTLSGISFGNARITDPPPATRITGSVFFDFDGDGFRGIQNPTEPDLPGRTVFLDANGNDVLDAGERKTTTDGGGNFVFDNLTPGNYRVGTILPAGWTYTDPSSGFFDVMVASNQTISRRFATTFADDDDTISEADQKPGNQVKVGGSVNFSIANVTDVDFLRFTVKKGQKIGFDLDRATGSSLNSLLRLFDANGNQLAINDDGAAPGEGKGSDSYLSFTFNAAGTFYIGVSNNANKAYEPRFGFDDNGVGTTGGYKLSLIAQS